MKSSPKDPLLMRPAVFITASTLLGCLFAFQDWLDSRLFNHHVPLSILLQAWGMQYFLCGALLWLLWWRFRGTIENVTMRSLLTIIVPLSIAFSVTEEAIWVAFFPRLPIGAPPMPYWERLRFHLDAELVDSLVIFWSGFFLFRGVGYYLKFRERQLAAARLEAQLANAQMRALRMQLNPHFLFNTMNSISSLMRTDVSAADEMLEQLSSLLRMTFERGEAQFIPLKDELEFVQLYLGMQQRRHAGLVRQEFRVDPKLYDALVPTMILQPLVENAYAHGLSKLCGEGQLVISAELEGSSMQLSILNSGDGLLTTGKDARRSRPAVGLANVRERLQTHYGAEQSLSIREVADGQVKATIVLPMRLSKQARDQ